MSAVCTPRTRADRRRDGVADIIRRMRNGVSLHVTNTADGPKWALTDGTHVSPELAAVLIRHPNIVGVGDALPGLGGHLHSQTFRFVE